MSKIQKQSHIQHLGVVEPLRVLQDAFGFLRDADVVKGTSMSKRELAILPQINALPSTLNSATLNFEIDNNIDRIQEVLLRMTVTETGAANAYVMMSAFHALSYMTIEFGSGERYRIEGYELYLWYLSQVDTDELANKDAVWNVGATLGAGASIVASGSDEYYLPCTLFLRGLVPRELRSQKIKLSFYFQSNVVESGTGVHGLSSVSLYVLHDRLSEQERNAIRTLYNGDGGYAKKFLDPITQTFNETFVSGTPLTRTMNQVAGLCPFMIVGVRNQNPVATTAPRTYNDYITDLTVLEGDGSNITQTLTSQWLTYDAVNDGHFQKHGSALFANLAIKPIIFCQDVDKAWDGTVSGFHSFSGNQQIRLTPNNSSANGLEVTAFCYADFVIKNGDCYIKTSK